MFTKFLDPKNDVAFRKIFGTEKNKDILIHFLNDVIEFDGSPIHKVTFLKTIQDPEAKDQKTSIVDILCEDEKGTRYVVEMQVAKEKGFEKRAQYYASKAYCSQISINEKYFDLKAVIFLAITDFIMFPKKKEYKSDHVILDKKSHEHDLKDFSFTFLELPKFRKNIDQLDNTTEMWMYFFKNAADTSQEELNKLAEHEGIIKRAYEELSRFAWNDIELRTYEQQEKYLRGYIASMDQKLDEGKEIGRVVGREEGIEIGIEIGKEKGREEGIQLGIEKERKQMVKNLLFKGISIQTIQEISGILEEEILTLQEESLLSSRAD